MLAHAARAGVGRLLHLGNFWGFASIDGVRQINDETIAMIKQYPGRIDGLCFLNPNHEWKHVEAEIDRCIAAGLCGIKFEYEVNARSRLLDPIMEKVAAEDAFVLHHAWYKTTQGNPHESNPADVADLARRHPKTTILMAHLTAAGMRGVLDIQPYDNLLVDTSGSQPFYGIIEYAVNKLGDHRVLFGSDICGRDFGAQLGRVTGADLTEDQRERVLRLNAERLLKIESP